MRWTRKAQIQRACAALPRGDIIYARLQRRFGNVNSSPYGRVPHHIEMLHALRNIGFNIHGARCIEVGTGHVPTLPILFHLVGAGEIVTVDLNRRLQWDLAADAMATLGHNADELVARYAGLVDETALRERLQTMDRFIGRPVDFFEHAGIRYVAPGDAATMPYPAASFDLHFSTTVLEHIAPAALALILVEACRLLRRDGVACHIIDPSDHFAHADKSISPINFLSFSKCEWDKVADNQFGYCNRLRASELLGFFSDAGLDVIAKQAVIDERSLREIESGFPLDPSFSRFTKDDLCTVTLEVTARPR